jgi:hypothetical protein
MRCFGIIHHIRKSKNNTTLSLILVTPPSIESIIGSRIAAPFFSCRIQFSTIFGTNEIISLPYECDGNECIELEEFYSPSSLKTNCGS